MWWRFSFSRARRSAASERARLSSSSDRARLTVSLPRWRCSSRPRLGRAGSGRLGAGRMAAGGGSCAPLSSSAGGAAASGSAAASAARRGLFLGRERAPASAAASSALRFSSARRRSSSLCSSLGAVLAAARFLERRQARFLGLAQQLRLKLLAAGHLVLRRTACAAAGAAGFGAGFGRFGDRLGLGRFGRRSFARAAEDAPLLDLDHDRVRAAVAEALLDLAGLDRALEAQRRPGAKLRFFGLVCHSIPSSNLVSRAGPQGGFAAFQDRDRGQ